MNIALCFDALYILNDYCVCLVLVAEATKLCASKPINIVNEGEIGGNRWI